MTLDKSYSIVCYAFLQSVVSSIFFSVLIFVSIN